MAVAAAVVAVVFEYATGLGIKSRLRLHCSDTDEWVSLAGVGRAAAGDAAVW